MEGDTSSQQADGEDQRINPGVGEEDEDPDVVHKVKNTQIKTGDGFIGSELSPTFASHWFG